MSELGLSPLPEHDAQVRKLRNHFADLIRNATGTTENVNRFPGTMPLTMSRRHLGMIARADYVALEKSDGTRYMLLAVEQVVLLIDRRMKIYVVEPNPRIMAYQDLGKCQDNTVLDGELTFNRITEMWEYLIYDAVAIQGDISVAGRDYRERMRAAEIYVAGPRVWAPLCSGLLRLRIKDYYEKKELRNLFSRVKKEPGGMYLYMNNDRRDGVISNHNDGLIFSPVGMGYQVKNCPALLKWKPPSLNSIDFMLQLERTVDPHKNNEPSVRSFIAYKGSGHGNVRLREVYFPSKLKAQWAANFNKYNNSIVELSYDRAAGEWRYIRQRDDKDTPNFSSTVIDTMESIAESMGREEIVRHMEKHSRRPPKEATLLIESHAENNRVCTFRDDLFDGDNEAYMQATPISLFGPPRLQLPAGRTSFGRGRRGGERGGDRGGGGPRAGGRGGGYRGGGEPPRPDMQANGVTQNGGTGEPMRMPTEYNDDV